MAKKAKKSAKRLRHAGSGRLLDAKKAAKLPKSKVVAETRDKVLCRGVARVLKGRKVEIEWDLYETAARAQHEMKPGLGERIVKVRVVEDRR